MPPTTASTDVDVTVEPLSEIHSRLTITIDFEGHGVGASPNVVRPRRRMQRATTRAARHRRH